MTRKELINAIDEYINRCDNAETWEDVGLVEKALSLLEMTKIFLTK